MSSLRDSVGDLIPQDVLDVFTQERQSRRGKRSRRRSTIGRALSWFKGRRRKHLHPNTNITIDLLTPGSPVPVPLPSTSTVEDVTCPLQHVQENVFLEGNRPKYVQDLHTVAQEGLKLLQQDENRNGVDYQDDQSIISTMTARTNDDVSFSELGMSESESTAADTISTRSVTSYQSSRSGLTRQGSTFRPLKDDRKRGKSKSKVKKPGMVAGIPRHVQKELGLDRAAWIASHFTDAEISSGGVLNRENDHGNTNISMASVPDGAIMHLQSGLQAVTEDTPQLSLQEGTQDGLTLLQQLLPQSVDPLRSSSVAVPWMTTTGSCPSSPVMYVSPEATYMSKIIPNAILPPSVDVVELSRNRSRSSVRTVSKSSLASASPAPSRASSRASSRFSSRAPSLASSRISSRASTHQTAALSDCSVWSRSGSSETLVSDSSTISSSSTPRVASRISQAQETDGPPMVKDNPDAQNASFDPLQMNGDKQQVETRKPPESTGPFIRSLSVMKKSKKPPPPPSRSYSLHSRTYARTIAEHKSLQNGSQKVESPYGASTSRDGTKAVSSTDNMTSQRAVLSEQQLKKGLQMQTGSIPYSQTNGQSQQSNLKHFLPSLKSLTANGAVASPAMTTLMALLDVPECPKVLAPPPPPPETWAHNQRTFELLCGPGPANFEHWAQKRGLKIEVPIQITPGKMPATSQTTNDMKDSTVAPKIQSQDVMGTDLLNRTTLAKMPTDVQHPYANTVLLRLTHIHQSPSPSPPPEHIPPLPPAEQDEPLKEDASAQFQDTFNEIICPPPPPMFPPPPPPTEVPIVYTAGGQNETYVSIPPSLRFLLKAPPVPKDEQPSTLEEILSQNIPLPPQISPPGPPVMPTAALTIKLPSTSRTVTPPLLIPTPPSRIPTPPSRIPTPPSRIPTPPPRIPTPPPRIPTPPARIPTPPKQTPSNISSNQVQAAFSVPPPPPPPPLPADIKKEVKAITPERQEKPSPPPSTHKGATTEESPTPMVTPSILQQVRLRSIKSRVSQAEMPEERPKPQHQAKEDVPQRSITTSLVLSASDLPLQLATDQMEETLPATTRQQAQGTTLPSDTQLHTETKVLSGSAEQVSLDFKHESNNQVSNEHQEILKASTGPIKESTSAQSGPQIPNKTESEPKIIVKEIQNSTQEPSTVLSPVETKDQACTNDLKEIQNDSIRIEDELSPPKLQLEQDIKLVKPQISLLGPSKLSPVQKVAPISIPSASMSLQDAIRLKTAAMSSTENKRLSLLHSPPLSAGSVSPTSTANFIFAKNTKKVVIEKFPSSPESKLDLKKALVNEFHLVSERDAADTQNPKSKIPPPVAKKPSAKSDNITQNSSERNVDTVQTAGQ